MITMRPKLVTLLFSVVFLVRTVLAQTGDSPVEYMKTIVTAHEDMNNKNMVYMSAAAHGKRLRKVEKLRQQAIDAINKALESTNAMPAYKGDNSLKKSSLDFINFCHKVFTDDYAHIVDMEEISEQSVDEMQTYLLMQEKTEEKLKDANRDWGIAYHAFAAKNNVNLLENKSDRDLKIELASKLNKYHNKVYNIFFKCNWEDNQLTKAMNNKKVNDVEQCRNALIKYAVEGLKGLDSLRSFEGDAALAQSCKQDLEAYKKIAETEVPKLTAFYLVEENFNNIKKAFSSKSSSDRKKEDVDAYNKAVKEMNDGVNAYNQTNNNVNSLRGGAVDNWNNTSKTFLDNNMPYFKKGH